METRRQHIDSLTHHKSGLTLIDYDEGKETTNPYYEIHVGSSSDIRYETFFLFRANKSTCALEVMNEESDFVPLKTWQQSAGNP